MNGLGTVQHSYDGRLYADDSVKSYDRFRPGPLNVTECAASVVRLSVFEPLYRSVSCCLLTFVVDHVDAAAVGAPLRLWVNFEVSMLPFEYRYW
ncbi:unannotated protein [freshwater metagenome]|uniref:Unannotated protein n=1 Tax=freshwater metagenome TaxID=449393 RepID=A0A6J6X4U1_9ZZZZ